MHGVNGHGQATCQAACLVAGQADPPAARVGRPVRAVRVTAVFAASPDQVSQARYFAEAMLAGWPVADDIVLIVSELAANAVVHSASGDSGQFWVHLETVPGRYVWVEVLDQGGQWVRRDHGDGRPHGLDIVARLATESGVDGDERSGWISWARLDLPEPGAVPQDGAACAQLAAGQPAVTPDGHAGRPGTASAAAGPPDRGLAAAGSSRRES